MSAFDGVFSDARSQLALNLENANRRDWPIIAITDYALETARAIADLPSLTSGDTPETTARVTDVPCSPLGDHWARTVIVTDGKHTGEVVIVVDPRFGTFALPARYYVDGREMSQPRPRRNPA